MALEHMVEQPYYWRGDHYSVDQRLGDPVLINGVDAYVAFNADLHTKSFAPPSASKTMIRRTSRSYLRTSGFTYGIPQMTLGFYVGGIDYADAARNANRMLQDAQTCTIEFMGDDCMYECSIASLSMSDTEVPCYYDVQVTFDYVKHLPMRTVDVTVGAGSTDYPDSEGTIPIDNPGTVVSKARVKVIPDGEMHNFIVSTLMFEHPQSQSIYLFDGFEGKMTENGKNCFERSLFTEFAPIQPGHNEVDYMVGSMTGSLHITIDYYPTFLL